MRNAKQAIELKEKLRRKDRVVGSWITIGHPMVAEIFSLSEFDFLVIDIEHSSMSLRECEDLIRVIDLSGIPALVRLTRNDAALIKRVADAGAAGIVVPLVNSSADARAAVESIKYPPVGERGVGLARAQGYGRFFNEYLEWQAAGTIVIAQIEHVDGVSNLDDIVAVEGVDGVIVGPYDLSASIGVAGQFDNPLFERQLEQIKSTCNDRGVTLGIHVVEPLGEEISRRLAEGFNFIAASLDTVILERAAAELLKVTKEC